YEEIDRGYVAFRRKPKRGKITGKARTMLADYKLPTTFWAEAVNIGCYVQNRVLVVKPHNTIPYELFHGRTPTLSFMRLFGCPVTILNTKNHLGKFDGKADEGFFVGYSLNSKAFRVFNSITRIVKENLNIRFSEHTPNVVGTQYNDYAGTKASDNAGQARKDTDPVKYYILLPLWTTDPPFSQNPKSSQHDGFKPLSDDGKKVGEDPSKGNECNDQEKKDNVNSTINVNTVSSTVNAAGTNKDHELLFDPNMPTLEDVGTFNFSNEDEDDDEVANMNNLDTSIQVSPTSTTRIHKDHPLDQVIGDLHSATQTRNIKRHKGDILLVQVYTDDIIFGLTRKELLLLIILDTAELMLLVILNSASSGLLPWLKLSMGNLRFMPRKPKRKNTQVPHPSGSTEHVAYEAVYKELDDRLIRAATTTFSLEAKRDSGNIKKTQSKATPNEASSPGTTSSGCPRCQKAIGNTIAQTRFENSNDTLLVRDNTLQSDEDRLKLNELMELCTNLQLRVLDLKKTKTTQAHEITSLKRRVKKLEKKQRLRTHKIKRLYKVGLIARVYSSEDDQSLGEDASKQRRNIHDINADEDTTLINDQDDAEMFDVNDLYGKEVFVEKEVADKKVNAAGEVNAASIATTVSAAAIITTDEITLAQALVEIMTSKPKAKGVVIQEPSESRTTTTTISSKKSHDKGKAIMIEEPMKPKKKDQVRLDEEVALKLEQQELTDAEKATLFMQFLKKRIKFFAAKASEEKRNKPPTQAQQRKIMCTYLKNMEGKKLKDLKNKSFNSIQKMFDRAFNRVNIFMDFKTELVEGSSKRGGEELTQRSSKKQKVDDSKETTELKDLMKIIPDEEEVAIDAIPLAVKSPKIID
nr:retrovirus-related Pol polyprotein from transposon TNT 1-94 [Tanacetum cinerariifolium]